MPEPRSEPAPTLDEDDPPTRRAASPAAAPARSGLHPRRRRRGRPPGPGDPDPGATLAEHRTLMLRTARRVSACEDDAHDAVQAASERYLRHADRVEAETRIGWLVTVARNEALRVRTNRRLGEADADDRPLASPSDGPEERAARADEIAEAREALSRLKPQERQALWLQASGLSYAEIAEALGWTTTKVNRNIAEGRASLRLGVESIATGEQCAAAAPRIERLVAGEADRDDLRALRAHVRRCAPCRARLRRARGGRMLLVPPVLLGWVPWAARAGGGAPGGLGAAAERAAPFLPASVSGLTEVGVAATAGLATIALAGGVVLGGAGVREDDPAPRRTTTTAAATAGPRSSVLAATRPSAPQAAARYVDAARIRAAEAAEDERRRRARAAARDREADRRAARRRAARRRAAERARLSAGSAGTGRATPAPASPAPATSAPSTAAPAPASPSGGSGSSGSGGSSSGGGGAAGEFGFE